MTSLFTFCLSLHCLGVTKVIEMIRTYLRIHPRRGEGTAAKTGLIAAHHKLKS